MKNLFELNLNEQLQQKVAEYIRASKSYVELREHCLSKQPIPALIDSFDQEFSSISVEQMQRTTATLEQNACLEQKKQDLDEYKVDVIEEHKDEQRQKELAKLLEQKQAHIISLNNEIFATQLHLNTRRSKAESSIQQLQLGIASKQNQIQALDRECDSFKRELQDKKSSKINRNNRKVELQSRLEASDLHGKLSSSNQRQLSQMIEDEKQKLELQKKQLLSQVKARLYFVYLHELAKQIPAIEGLTPEEKTALQKIVFLAQQALDQQNKGSTAEAARDRAAKLLLSSTYALTENQNTLKREQIKTPDFRSNNQALEQQNAALQKQIEGRSVWWKLALGIGVVVAGACIAGFLLAWPLALPIVAAVVSASLLITSGVFAYKSYQQNRIIKTNLETKKHNDFMMELASVKIPFLEQEIPKYERQVTEAAEKMDGHVKEAELHWRRATTVQLGVHGMFSTLDKNELSSTGVDVRPGNQP